MVLTKTRKTLGACSVMAVIGIMYSQFGGELRLSPAGAEIIGNAEGCISTPYKCPADVLTVGIGSTEYSGQKIEIGKKYSDLEIAKRWKNDIKLAEACVDRYADGRNLPQSVFDAMVSVTFNNGCGKVKNSTMFGFMRRGRYIDGCNQLPNWVYVKGKKVLGLVKRRGKERALCLTDLKPTR
nr:MAG TPA: lysozyme [Caudoviricetes sp.]